MPITNKNDILFDVRNVARYIAEGAVTQEDYQKHLDALEDCAANAEQSSVVMVSHARSRRVERLDSYQEEEES